MAARRDDPRLGANAPARAGDPIDLSNSVAGEEDPGASFDVPDESREDPPTARAARQPVGTQPAMSPGDEAPAGTPSTGENVCPQCGGIGRIGAAACPNCQGTGVVIVGIAGA